MLSERLLSVLLVVAKTYQNSRGVVTAARLARCSSWQALPVSREWLGWRRPNQACCNLHLIDECMESVETPIRNKTMAAKDLGCAVSLTLCLLNVTKKTWKGWQLKEIQETNSCVHPQLNVDCVAMFAIFWNVDWKMFILQNFYLHKFQMKIRFSSKGRNINHFYYHFKHGAWL